MIAVESYCLCLRRVYADFDNIAINVSRRQIPTLSFPLIIVGPNRVAI